MKESGPPKEVDVVHLAVWAAMELTGEEVTELGAHASALQKSIQLLRRVDVSGAEPARWLWSPVRGPQNGQS